MNKKAKKVLLILLSVAMAAVTVIAPASCGEPAVIPKEFKAVNLSFRDRNSIARMIDLLSGMEYDSSNPDDEDRAVLFTIEPVFGCWWLFENEFTEKAKKIYSIEDETQKYVKDPLGLFDPDDDEYTVGYIRYDGKAVDRLLTERFNMKPVHSSEPKEYDYYTSDEGVRLKFYYHKGYYYIQLIEGACGLDGIGVVFDCVVSDGTDYHIRYKLPYEDWNELSDEAENEIQPDETLYATVRKNSADGRDNWSVVRLSSTEYFDFSGYESVSDDDSWKQTYISYIKKQNRKNNNLSYSLAFIDDDTVPELIIESGIMADGGKVCTLRDGKVNDMDIWCNGLSYIEGENRFLVESGRMNDYSDEIFKIENGNFTLTEKGTYGLEGEDIYGEDVEEAEKHFTYYWNEKKVSKMTYKRNLKKAFDSSLSKDPYEVSCDFSEITDALLSRNFSIFPTSDP